MSTKYEIRRNGHPVRYFVKPYINNVNYVEYGAELIKKYREKQSGDFSLWEITEKEIKV